MFLKTELVTSSGETVGFYMQMGVSLNGGTPKTPQNGHF